MRTIKAVLTAIIVVSVLPTNAHSADGVLEINQTCAVHGGCFSGDTANFPVTIDGSAGKSYRLTGDLDLSSFPDTIAIDIDSPFVTLDLNGFEIAGSVTCTGSGVSLNCGPPGSGNGIRVNNGSDGALIRNGTIRNMDSSGVSSNAGRVTMMQLRAYNNARDGLRSQTGSIAVDCIAEENADDGFDFGVTSVIERSTAHGNGDDGFEIEFQKGVIKNSTARFNGARGFNMGHSGRFRDNTSDLNEEPDSCGGGVCTQTKRYYLTQTMHQGNDALDACAGGFHMASVLELLNSAGLAYDTVLGFNHDNAGTGPPTNRLGWVRDGSIASDSNCLAFTSSDPKKTGYLIGAAGPTDFNSPSLQVSPWFTSAEDCDVFTWVWCIED